MSNHLAALAICFAAPATADCLTASDMTGGISVTLDNGAIEVYRRDMNDPALVTVDGSGESGPAYRLVLVRGILVVLFETVDESAGAMNVSTSYSYPLAPADVPVPVAGALWQISALRNDSEGETPEDQIHQAGDLTPITIGECTYAAIPVTVAYGATYVEEITYLPDLGFGFLHWFQNEGGEKNATNLIALERAE